MNGLTDRTAREMLADLAGRKISASELLEAHLAANARAHPKLNAVVATDVDRARRDAKTVDEARAGGEKLGALAGLPMTIKDGFDVDGMPATAGNPAFANRDRHCADADMVKAARTAGAVIWGKTNVPFMLGDFQSYNDIYGTTNNPYDLARTPGGSSGGAAAALAAGITPLEIGSDIGGSLRHPANFCGVCSLKPTWDVLSTRGHVPPPPGIHAKTDLNVVGPMARNVGDLRLLWDVLRGNEGKAPTGVKGARIAVWDSEPGFPLARAVRAAVVRAADALSNAGVIVEHVRLPIVGMELLEAYLGILTPIVTAGVPEAVLAQFRALRESDAAARKNGASIFGPEAFRLRATASEGDIRAHMAVRDAMKDRLEAFYAEGWQAILAPISIVPPFPHLQHPTFNERTLDVDGEKVAYSSMLSWIALATALHEPALAVPAGQTETVLPVGVQLIGPPYGEDRLFDFAAAIEERLGLPRPASL